MSNKPQSMSVKEWLVKKLALSIIVPERVIDAVITNQFDTANDALLICKSIEISGFGKFVFNQSKAIKQMAKYMSQKQTFERILADVSISETRRRGIEMKLETTLGNIKALTPKV